MPENFGALKDQLHGIEGHGAKEIFREVVKPLQRRKEELEKLDNVVSQTRKFLSRVDRFVGIHPEAETAFLEFAESFDNSRLDELAARREANREKIWEYVSSQHSNYLGVIDGLEFTSDKEKQAAIGMVIRQTADYLRHRRGLPTVTIDPEQNAVLAISENLLHGAKDFYDLKTDFKHGDKWSISVLDLRGQVNPANLTSEESSLLPIQQKIAFEKNQAAAQIEIAGLNPEVKMFAMRDWVKERIADRKKGIKIVASRFQERIIDLAHRIGDKENGIGGRLYWGPPGTGKTELAIEVNRQEGYKSRVISVHYWTSFSQLFGEALIQIGHDKSAQLASHADRVKAVLDYLNSFGEGGQDKFWGLAERVAAAQGKKVEEFLGVQEGGESILPQQKQQVFAEYKKKLETRLLLIGEGVISDVSSEDAPSWVEGEIPLAIRNKERVILDEIDKAGPGSLDSLSRFLAMSPDSKTPVKLRDLEIKTPVWFRIDATANVMSLNDPSKEFLYDRFNHIHVDYPPPKDEMAIAATWIADQDGNIPLDENRQHQMTAFFIFLLPELRRLYREKKISQPVSLRSVKDFCALIVDSTTHNDRGMAIDEAIEQLFLKQRNFAANDEQREALAEVLGGYRQIFQTAVPINRGFGEVRENEKGQTVDLRAARMEAISERLKSTIGAPFFQAISAISETFGLFEGKSGLERDKVLLPSTKVARIGLGSVRDELNTEEIGQHLYSLIADPIRVQNVDKTRIFWTTTESGTADAISRMEVICDVAGVEIVETSTEGKTVLVKEKETGKYHVLWLNKGKLDDLFKLDPGEGYQMELSPDGNRVFVINTEKNSLGFHDVKMNTPHQIDFHVVRHEVSADGRMLLVEDRAGITYLFDLEKSGSIPTLTASEAIRKYEARNLAFAGEHLIFQKGTNRAELLIN